MLLEFSIQQKSLERFIQVDKRGEGPLLQGKNLQKQERIGVLRGSVCGTFIQLMFTEKYTIVWDKHASPYRARASKL